MGIIDSLIQVFSFESGLDVYLRKANRGEYPKDAQDWKIIASNNHDFIIEADYIFTVRNTYHFFLKGSLRGVFENPLVIVSVTGARET